MTRPPDILCIGSVLWDMVGRAPSHMNRGADVPGRIVEVPGGVALNIAATLVRLGLRPALLSAVGRDGPGEALIAACAAMGLDCRHIYRSEDLPTDRYMAIEGANGLIAAIADAHSLEAAGAKILAPLRDGALATADAPYRGLIAVDGNLTQALLETIATDPTLVGADLRLAPASPGKAERLRPFLRARRGTLYVNLEEAGILCQTRFDGAADAAAALVGRGAARALVTDGARAAAEDGPGGPIRAEPPRVLVTRVTGAGDTFMAAHMAAEQRGAGRAEALESALAAAAAFVSGETPA